MAPELRPWMRPEDLVLFQLEQLPWPAYTRLVETYFSVNGAQVSLIDTGLGHSDFLLTSGSQNQRFLRCCSVREAGQLENLDLLRRSMKKFQASAAILATPGDFPPQLALQALDLSIDLYSGNRLRAKIELLSNSRRREVLDSIRAQPELTDQPA